MAGRNDIVFRLIGDAKSAVKAFKEGGEAGEKMRDRLKGLVSVAGAAAGAAGFGALAAGAFNLGTELSGLQQKSEAVFGDSLGDVEDWADSVKRNFGLSRTEVVGLATDMSDLLKPMGFTTEQAAGMSTDVLGLAGALSEWTGGQQSVADVSDILTKAMLGERDSLKALGVSINQAEVDQRALAIAQAEGRDEITQMDRALATQELIFEKTTDAQQAYADGGNKLLRAQNSLRSVFKDVRDQIVLALVPAMETAVTVGGAVIRWARENRDILLAVGAAVGILAGAAGIAKLLTMLKAAKAAVIAFNAVLAANPIGLVVIAVAGLAAGLVIAYNRSDKFREIVHTVWEWVQKAGDVLKDLGESALEILKSAFEKIQPIIQAHIDVLRGLISFVTSVFTGDWRGAWDAVKDIAQAVFNGIREAFGLWRTLMSSALSAAGRMLARAGVALWDWMIDGFAALPGLIVDAIGNVGSLLFDLGKDLIDGLVRGIGNAPNAVKNAIANLVPGGGLVGRAAGFLGLANGGLVPPNQPFLAMLGDNRREPEVVSPVSTMRAALAAELASSGGAGSSGPQIINIQVGDTVVDRIVLDSVGRLQRTTGSTILSN